MEGITRLFQAMFAPAEAFEAAKSAPKLFMPILLIALLMTGITGYYAWNVDRSAIIVKSIEMSGRADRMPEGQMEQIVDVQSKVMKYSMPGGTLIVTPIMFLLIGLYFYLVARISGGETTFAQATAVAVYSSGPVIIWAVVALAIMLIGDFSTTLFQELVPSNVGYFVDPESIGLKLHTVLKSLDFFNLWRMILTIIGFSVITKSKLLKSSLVVIIPFVVMVGIGVLFVG